MSVQGLRRLLQGANDRFGILTDKNIVSQYSLDDSELIELFRDFLTDEEKMKMFEMEHIKTLSVDTKQRIIENVEDENIKLKLLENSGVISKLSEIQISNMLQTMSTKIKIALLLDNRYNLSWYQLSMIASTLDFDDLFLLLRQNRSSLQEKGIRPYTIVRTMNKEKQLEFVSKMEDNGLSLAEKRQVLAILRPKAKKSIDRSSLPPEYLTAFQMKVSQSVEEMDSCGKIKVNFNKEMESYRDLDELIFLNPLAVATKNQQKLLKLCDICPKISIKNPFGEYLSTSEEYKSAETWIEGVLQKINPEWTNVQKVAFIDAAIGKKISYTPDYDTEVFNANDACALWKIINSGYGICEGIAEIEKYILDKIGVESEIVSSREHSFLKLKGISLPTKSGKQVVGDTILDPTWNLWSYRYGLLPLDFCKSYSEIRSKDVTEEEGDTESHKNDEMLSGATLNLDDECLKEIFSSVGFIDKQGKAPFEVFLEQCKEIRNMNYSEDEIIKRQLMLLKEYHPEFFMYQHETMKALKAMMWRQRERLGFNRCVIDKVYKRDDRKKGPVLYMYMDFAQAGKKFYFADKENACFSELSREEFESKFECYDTDLNKTKGYRPWEDKDDVDGTDIRTSKTTVISKEVSEECIS